MSEQNLGNSSTIRGRRNLVSKACKKKDKDCGSLDELLEKYDDSWDDLKAEYKTQEDLIDLLSIKNNVTVGESNRIEAYYNPGKLDIPLKFVNRYLL